jgi:glycosyltransferase involved in cell wall biosynthesis
MTKPLVSVLMTAYNREKYLAEAIESVLASTFTHFELIIVDDCSTDRTVEIAKSYASRDSRVSVHINEKNLGDYPNRNRAASLASGRYLKYIDSDDYIYPHGLAVIVNMMEQFPEAALGIGSLPQDAGRPYPFQLLPREAYRRHYFEASLFDRPPLSTVMRRKFFHAVGGFSGKRMVGDFELWHILAARYPIVLMPDGIVWYREHGEQEMNDYRHNPLCSFSYQLIACDQLARPECPLAQEEKLLALRRLQRGKARFVLRTVASRKPRLAFEMFRQSGLTPAGLFAAFTAVPARIRSVSQPI